MIEKCKKAMKIGNLPSLAIEVEYYKRLQLGDSEQEAYEYVLYRKTNILWEYRRDYHGAVI
jgi:hypothetical protein